MEKKVLIVGAAEALGEKLKEQGVEVFSSQEADIREDKPCELLEFALESSVGLTIAFSPKANIAEIFHANGQLIFAPGVIPGLKTLYSARVPTVRFAVFDKISLALDYLKNADYPVVINGSVFMSFDAARRFTEKLIGEIVITEYAFGHSFTFYLITDGAHPLPIVSVGHGEYSYAPDYKVSQELEAQILDAVASILEGHCGIFGIKCVVDDGRFKVLGIRSYFSSESEQAVLNLIEEDFYTLFKVCALGSLETYDYVKMSEDFFAACNGISAQGRTLSRAIANLQELTNNI